jgi:Ca2+:H+ antiporter
MSMALRLKKMFGLKVLLTLVPVSIIAELAGADAVVVFITSAIGVIPLAGLIGEATESLAAKTGPRLGGLLNATLGNAAELIIALFALNRGLLDLVRASITGSILGNLLLVLGASLLLGGIKHGVQKFDRGHAGLDATLLILSVIALGVPSLFNFALEPNFVSVESLSIGASLAILLMYGLVILYSLTARTHEVDPVGREAHPTEMWSTRRSLITMAVAVAFIALLSEFLVGSVEVVTETLGLSEFFLGIILIPIVGNVAEHIVAVQVALKDKMDLSLSIAIGSSLQVALFVAPVLVLVSLLFGHPLALEFNSFELAAVAAAALIAAFVSLDGESNWLEGAMLLVVYVILGLAFFFL